MAALDRPCLNHQDRSEYAVAGKDIRHKAVKPYTLILVRFQAPNPTITSHSASAGTKAQMRLDQGSVRPDLGTHISCRRARFNV